MASAAPQLGSLWERLCALPANKVGEIVAGELHASPRPAVAHARAASRLGGELDRPFDRGSGGAGGWILLDEPELHLAGDVLVPDLAGWRRERLQARQEGGATARAVPFDALELDLNSLWADVRKPT